MASAYYKFVEFFVLRPATALGIVRAEWLCSRRSSPMIINPLGGLCHVKCKAKLQTKAAKQGPTGNGGCRTDVITG